ncbi:MAG: GvpL/GvpF family gas vesicle protein [Rhodomicrobiaceae bacterium]
MELKCADITTEDQVTARRYLYCIIHADEPLSFAAPGVAGTEHPVHTINHRGIAAVVSASPATGYESTKRNMTAHMKVLEEVMRSHAILPIRFNSVSPNAEAVRDQVLAPGIDTLTERLAKIDGHIEMGIKAFWREEVLYNEIVAANDDIRRLRDRIAGRPPEATYRERLRLGEMVEKALVAKRARESDAMLAQLCPFAEDVVVRDPITERMALNAALLLKASDQVKLEQSLNALDAEQSGRMTFKCVGPVPPYNFVEIALG